MPAYNAEAYIVEALESVLCQNYVPMEIIVVDDGSTDATAARARTLDSRISVLSQAHAGIFTALNRGIRAARGEWLAFHDADDLWTATSLADRFAAFSSVNAPECVFGHVQNFYSPETDRTFRERVICPPDPLPGIGYYTLLQRRQDFLRVGFFEQAWRVGSFIEWWERATALGLKHVVVPQVVLCRRLHLNNTSLRDPDGRQDFARILNTVLSRKRATRR